jgi:hypothetical protein
MRKRMLSAAALFAAAALAACDGGSATAVGDSQLSAAQAASLNRALLATGAGFASGSVPAGARGTRSMDAAGTGSFTFTFNTSAPCAPSGSMGLAGNLAGSADATAHTAAVQANVAVKHQSCRIRTDDGSTFTLNGDPKIDITLNAASGPNGLTAFTLTESGAFTWDRGDGNSGRCTVDVTASLVTGTQNVKLTGSFCGFAVDGTIETVD